MPSRAPGANGSAATRDAITFLFSALLAEIASREAKFAAAEFYFEKYGVPPLSEAAIERIEAEWSGAAPRKRRRAV